MDNTSHTSSVTLGSQVRRIFRHRLLILLSVVIFAVAGAAYGYMTNSKYTSKASLVVYPLVVDPAGTGSANSAKVDIATESRVASSREVAQNAAKALIANGDTLSEAQLTSRLMNSVKVTGTSQTAVLDIEVTRPNGTEAARYANAMANAYLQVRSESLKSSVDSALHQIDEQISASRRQQPCGSAFSAAGASRPDSADFHHRWPRDERGSGSFFFLGSWAGEDGYCWCCCRSADWCCAGLRS